MVRNIINDVQTSEVGPLTILSTMERAISEIAAMEADFDGVDVPTEILGMLWPAYQLAAKAAADARFKELAGISG